MKKFKLLNLDKISMFFLLVLLFFFGMEQNLGAQGVDNESIGLSRPLSLATIITSAPTGVTGTSATLNGSVNPGNESTTVTFEYSTQGNFPDEETPPPISVSATPSPISGSGYIAVSAAISGLTPGTVYYYRIVAVNGSGTREGDVNVFSTSPPATVSTGIASPITTTTATLNGTVNANNNSTVVTFEYGLTTSYGTTVTADQSPVTGSSDTAVSKAITGLTPNTTYHFRVVGDNALGTSYSEDGTFFTSAQTAPTASTQDATFSLVANTATLNGVVNANNANATVTFEYGTTTAYGNTVTADQSPVLGASDTQVSKYITGLLADTTYHYRVVAVNGIGTTNGADMTFFNTVAPYAKTEEASSITQTSARLNGTVNSKTFEGTSETTVTFEYGLTAAYGNTVTAMESPISGEANQMVSYILTGLSPNTTYHYRVVADNVNGTGTGDDMTFTTSSLPIVTTETAAPVGSNSATLNGTVNANGDSTTVTFEYGLTTSYGTTVTADQSPVSGTANTAVSRAITGLANGTTYHYRVVGTNSSGTVNGEDRTFTTGIAPPTVTTDAATGIGVNSATLNGTVNANGLSSSVSFQWGFTTEYDRTDAAIPVTVTGNINTSVSFTPATLLPFTTYHYRVVAQNAGGTVYGADMSFTTAAAPTVTTNVATTVTTTGATLNGTVNANTFSSTVTFEYGTTTSYGTTVTADQSPVTGSTDTAVSAALTGLTPSTTYHYRVVGTNVNGTSNGEDMTFVTTVGAPIVTTGSASPLPTGAVLNGTVNAQNASTTVTIEYGTTLAYGSSVTADPSPVTGSNDTAVTATISGLAFNQTYNYRVVGTNSSGTTYGANMTFTTTLNPTAHTGVATNILATSAVLNGTANGNNGSWSVRFDYGTTVAYGSTQTATPSTVSGNTDTPVTAAITGLTRGTTYHYRTTVYSGGFNYYGSDMTFSTLAGAAVTTNAATSVGLTTATVNGTVNANGESTTVTFEYGFTTSYSKTLPADQSPVTGSTNTSVSVDLDTLIPGTTYHYRVIGTNVNGTVYGADMTFTTGSVAPTVVTDPATGVGATGATLNGTVNANNDSTTVTFEYGLTTSYGTTVTADQSPVTGYSSTAVSNAVTGLTPNTTYHYRVVGQNGSGTSNGSDMTFTTGTNTPTAATNAATGVGADSAVLNGTVNANGSSTTVTFEFGATTAYGRILTADQSPVTGTSDTAVSYTINGLTAGTVYHYRVVAQNAYGTTTGSDMTLLTSGNAPTVTTGAASLVGGTYATLNGTVNAQNGSTTVTFEYGTTTAYGTTVTAVPGTVNGNTDTAVSSTLTGLSQTATYHYRVVGQNAYGTGTGADMTFTTGTVSLPTVTTREITNVTSTSATSGGTVTDEGNGSVTARGVCFSTSPDPTIGDSTTTNGSGLGAFTSSITGLSGSTTYYVRAYATNVAGTGYGVQRTFTTNSETVSVSITNPTEGEQVSGTVTIEATAASNPAAGDTVNAVSQVEFYIDDVIIGTDTSAPYEWGWDTTAESDGAHVIKVVAYTTANESSQDDITVVVFNGEAELLLNRTRLNFGAVPDSVSGSSGSFYVTYDQVLLINSSGGTLNWSITENASWLSASPASGTGPGVVNVGVDPTGLSAGTYTANLTIENSASPDDSAVVVVHLVVYNSGAVSGPFGTFSTPSAGSTVMSSIPVTGWVLDDIAVTSVKIYRSPVSADGISGSSMVYIGDADLVDGARPDVETAYPDYPLNYQAGWGYMLLTNALPGDGTYTLYAIATDMEGNEVTLGSKTITVDNSGAVLPFGAIDTPVQGGEVSGSAFVNFGWALTPQPNTIPVDGSTIKVWVDGVSLPGHPAYNIYRQDIAEFFPGYNNSDGAVGYMTLDTTAYINGVHTIAWSVTDDAGNSDGIGSRYFSIINTGSVSDAASSSEVLSIKFSDGYIAQDYMGPVIVRKGFVSGGSAVEMYTDENNIAGLVIKELEPVQIQPAVRVSGAKGYSMIAGRPAPLPIGSTFDERTGKFSWQPGPGFIGSYSFTFIFRTDTGEFYRLSLEIVIEPKFIDKAPDTRGVSNY